MVYKNYLLVPVGIILLATLTGCGKRYKRTELKSLTTQTADTIQEQSGITLFTKKLKQQDCEEFFAGVNPLYYGIQPVQLTILNNSKDTIKNIRLKLPNKQLLTSDEVIERLKQRVVLEYLAGFALIPLAVSVGVYAGMAGIVVAQIHLFLNTGTFFTFYPLIPISTGIACAGGELTIAGSLITTKHYNNTIREENMTVYSLQEQEIILPASITDKLIFCSTKNIDKQLDLTLFSETKTIIFKNILENQFSEYKQ